MNAANLDLKSVIKIVKQPIEEGTVTTKQAGNITKLNDQVRDNMIHNRNRKKLFTYLPKDPNVVNFGE